MQGLAFEAVASSTEKLLFLTIFALSGALLSIMAARKKVLLKVIILGDSG